MLTMTGLIVAILLGLAFAMDLVVGFPFQKASVLMDSGFIFAAILLGIISWMTLREVG